MSLALLACAPGPARPPVDGAAGIGLARLEAAREPGSAALIARADAPVSPDSLLAIRALGRAADPAAIARLVAFLRDPDPQRRTAAAEALGHAGLLGADVGAAEPALLAILPAAGPSERLAVLTALGRLGTAAAVPALAAALDTTWPEDQRDVAAIALGVLGRRKVAFDDRARAGLLARARARDPNHVYAATYALAHEPDPPVRDADRELAELAPFPDPEVRFLALTGLARRKAPAELARPRFAAALRDRDFRVAVAAVRGLAALADDDSLTALTAWLATTLQDMPSGTGTIHPVLEALSILSARPGPPRPELAALARAVAQRPTTDLVHARIACALAADAARTPDWRPPLQCADDLERKLSETLLSGHGFGGSPEERLARLLELAADADARVQLAALSVLAAQWSELEHPALSDLFSRLIATGPSALAGAAAEAVQARFSKTPRPPLPEPLLPALLTRAARERDGELFAGLAAALAATGAPAALPPCRDALTHPNFTVRAAARACVTALAGDPGPALAAGPSPLPPHDPAALTGPVRWRLTTTRGVVDIELDPTDAPWHVAAVVALTRRGFYDGLTFHRVVPGFVVQGGDPDGTGWGGPGFNLPSEPGEGRFDAGAVGIADAGKDTGGSQFFVMHARAPHLEGRYTRIGRVTAGLDTALALVVGDAIVRAELRD